MTDTELRGRALDAEVHKTVIGREARWSAAIHGDWMDDSAGRDDVRVPRYSADIAAAMSVVEKMRADGWSFACTLYAGKLPYASFCKNTAASSRNAEAESLPEAICKAALSATNRE